MGNNSRRNGPRLRRFLGCLAAAGVLAGASVVAASSVLAQSPPVSARPTVVLVHGAWADASGWSGVVKQLQHDGYPVAAIANPLR